MARSLAVIALTPASATAPGYRDFVTALRARFGRRSITQLDGSAAASDAIQRRQALFVYIDRQVGTDFWIAHQDVGRLLLQAEEAHRLIIPIVAMTVGMPAPATMPPELAFFARKQALAPELVAQGKWPQLARRIAGLLAINYDYRWARLLMWCSAAAPFAVALLFCGIFIVFPDVYDRAFHIEPGGVRGTLNEYIVVLLTQEPHLPLILAYLLSPLLIVLGLWHYQAVRLRQWQAFGGYALADLFLASGAAIFFTDWSNQIQHDLIGANLGLFQTNLVVFGPLLVVGIVLAVGIFARISQQIVRPISEEDMRYLTLSPADRVERNLATDIFISADTGNAGQALWSALTRQMPARRVFRDAATILGGADFDRIIRQAVNESRVILALIGPNWISVRNADGGRRLDDPDDYVRLELATALRERKLIIPILIGQARMPLAHELPPDLQMLTTLRPMSITDPSVSGQTVPLFTVLNQLFQTRAIIPLRVVTGAIRLWSVAAVLLLIMLISGLLSAISVTPMGCVLLKLTTQQTDCGTPQVSFVGASDPYSMPWNSKLFRRFASSAG